MSIEPPPGGEAELELTGEPRLECELDMPRRAPGVDLVGAVDASGYSDQQWLVCIDGSRYMRATRVLYGVLQHADGRTNFAEIAQRVSVETGRQVSADQVLWLIKERLVPAGLIVGPQPRAGAEPGNGPEAAPGGKAPAGWRRRRRPRPPAAPLLAIQRKLPILPYQLTAPVTDRLRHLFALPVVLAVLLAGAAINVWLYTSGELTGSIHTLIFAPGLILVLFLLDVPTRIFHELGHASAMRRADVPHGDIGVALYVIVPVYYTDVTHAYRLERSERLRIDLGGMYFDLISIIGLFLAWSATRLSVLVIAMMLIGFSMLRQFTPFMRFDGYYVMADVIGVHEPLSMIGALVREHLPGQRDRGPRLLGVTPRVKLALAGYLAVLLLFLLRPLIVLNAVGGTAAMLTQLGDSAHALWSELTTAVQTHDPLGVIVATLQLCFWALIPLGLALFFVALLRVLLRGGRALGGAAIRHVAAWAERRSSAPAEVAAAPSAAHAAPPAAPAPPPTPPEPVIPSAGVEADGLPLIVEVDSAVPAVPEPVPAKAAANGELEQLELRGIARGLPRRAVIVTLEGTLERAAAHQADELRELVNQVRTVYERELTACRREIELLRDRALRSERDRERLQASLAQLEAAFTRQVATLTALGDDVIRRAEAAKRERDVTLAFGRDA